jgi:TonB family protein
MRPFICGLLLLAVADGPPVILESRTQLHSITVEVRQQGQFNVRIVDLRTNETLFSRDLAGVPSELVQESGDRRITVRVGPAPYGITTSAEIERGDMIIDSLHTVWSLTPHRARIRSEGAMRVGGDVRAPIVTRKVEPQYTDDARKGRISGIVIIETLVDKAGNVKDAVVLKGLPDGLSEAALSAVKQWQFQPATLNGEPVDVIFNLTVNFKVDSTMADR